jgi:nucleoside 2-deoxyribosyltransferase
MKRIYLAGPIRGCTDEQARGWREQVKQQLAGLYDFSDPMARDYRGREHEVDPAEIVEEDVAALATCTDVLVNCERASWGTAMELLYASGNRSYILAFGAGTLSPWVAYHASGVVPTLDDAIAYLRGAA